MSFERVIFKGASWLAFFKLLSQIFSWAITIIVARILTPADYGLMEMATLISSYGFFFSELGLGAAIIQRKKVTLEDLSSIFWFLMGMSFILAILCFPIAYMTSAIFKEPRVIPITMATSTLFLMGGLQIVPVNIIRKEMRFKEIGLIEMVSVFISCVSMLIIARMGGGVWTLIGGHIIRSFTTLIQVYIRVKWFPTFHFDIKRAKSFLGFGIPIAIQQSLYYIYSRSDKFFAGRALSSSALGFYSYALDLSQIPTDKIVVLINQVSFSAFSQLQDDHEKFSKLYLNIVKITATIVFPIFVGGFLIGDKIVKILLNEKWYPMIPLFKYLCLAQIMTAINAVNNFVHNAKGKPSYSLIFNGVMSLLLPISFYFSVQKGLQAMLIPWFTTYMAISVGWIIITLNSLNINGRKYIDTIKLPTVSTIAMMITVLFSQYIIVSTRYSYSLIIEVAIYLITAVFIYCFIYWYFDRRIMNTLKLLVRK